MPATSDTLPRNPGKSSAHRGAASHGGVPRLLPRLLRAPALWSGLVTLAVGLYRITTPEVWRDELSSWTAASRSVPELFHLLQHTDTSNGAYYLFLHFWIDAFGDSVLALRLPSALAMAVAAGCLVHIGRRMFSTRAGVTAALAFAAIPAVSRYAQEARSYPFTVMGVTLCVLLLLRALERPATRRWTAFALAVTATGAMSLVSLALLPILALITLVTWHQERNRRLLWGFALACVGAVIPLLPVAWEGSKQANEQISWIPAPTIADLRHIWPLLMDSYSVSYAMPIALLLLIGAALTRRIDRTQAALAATLAIGPVLLIWAVSQGGQSYWLARYLLPVVPAWALVIGAGLSALGRTAAVIGLAALTAISLPDQSGVRARGAHDRWNYPTPTTTLWVNYSGAAKIIEQNHRPGDGLVPLPWTGAPYEFDAAMQYHLPKGELGMHSVFFQESADKAGQLSEIDTPNPPGGIGAQPRLWVVGLTDPYHPTYSYYWFPKAMTTELQAHYRVQQEWHPSNNTTVSLLIRIPTPTTKTKPKPKPKQRS